MKNVNWTRILTIMLVVLVAIALLYIAGTILLRFTHALFILILGAMVAYVLTPVVNSLAIVVRARWIAIMLTYLLIGFILFILGVILFTPFVQQSQSLIDNLHTPSSKSLQSVTLLATQARTVQNQLITQEGLTTGFGNPVPSAQTIQQTKDAIARLGIDVTLVRNSTFYGPSHSSEKPGTIHGRQPPNPESQTKVPPSYTEPIGTQIAKLASDYTTAMQDPAGVRSAYFGRTKSDAAQTLALANTLHDKVSTAPILLLLAQGWLDDHNIAVDLHAKFGDAARQLSNQGTLLLDNAVAILSEAANLLLNTILILIVTFYFLSDGRRMIYGAVQIIPKQYNEQVWFFMLQLDKVLGGYIRGQLFLSALAGVLGGGGAAALGVPYPLLIGIMTFILDSIPVIGPLIVYIPAVAVALVFTSPFTTLVLFIWFVIFQQIVTNFMGPKIMGTAVGIHPLEAIAAVLVGYPLGGFIGAFLAVPVAGIVHIIIRELYAYFAHGQAIPTAPVIVPEEVVESLPEPPASAPAPERPRHAS